MPLTYYPIHEYEPVMKGALIGGIGIIHVFLAQFAIGGGLLLSYFEWLHQRGKSPNARLFVDGFFRVLVLISFVLGALTGVGMWFVSIQVSPQTIGLMVEEFHWLWAIEWTFFALEITTGYLFYRYGPKLSDKLRLRLLVLYSVAAWGSLFWINGILSWQLTPGDWSPTEVWAGFFNASFWPTLLFRTIVCITLAALAACILINRMPLDRNERTSLLHRAAILFIPMLIMPILGAWYLAVIPEDSRMWITGGSPAMMLFAAGAAGTSVLIGGYTVIGIVRKKLYVNGATATLLLALALAATASGEFVREGARKPYTVRNVLYSNAITSADIVTLRAVGSVTRDPYPLKNAADYPSDQLRLGAKVVRFQCSVCHTLTGMNGLGHLTASWSQEQLRLNLANLQRTKTFMPPFAGNAQELEAVVQLLRWHNADRPMTWPDTTTPALLSDLRNKLEAAGVR